MVMQEKSPGEWETVQEAPLETLTLRSLAGMKRYLELNIDGLTQNEHLVVVSSHELVELVSAARTGDGGEESAPVLQGGREVPARLVLSEPVVHGFGSFLDAEQFVILLQ